MRPLISGVVVGALLALAAPAAQAVHITITATPSSATNVSGPLAVSIEMNLLTGAAIVDSVQFGLDLDTNQTIFTISALQVTPANWDIEALTFSLAPTTTFDQILMLGLNLGSPPHTGPGSVTLVTFIITPPGVPGTLNLNLDPSLTFVSLGGTVITGFAPNPDFTGTIGSFSFSPIPEPGAMVLMVVGLVGVALAGWKSTRRS